MPTDYIHLKKLYLLVRKQSFGWLDTSKFKIDDYDQAIKNEKILVAETENKEIIGFLSIDLGEQPLYIHHFFVISEYQRQGVGSLFISTLKNIYTPPYQLKCLVKNEIGIAFYLKNGWFPVAEGTNLEGDFLLLEYY